MPLGIITIALRDPIFLQWKFSIVHWLFGLILVISNLYRGPILLNMLLSQLGPQSNSTTSSARSNVTNFAGFFLIFVGFLNLYFIYFMSLEAWVQFKIWGVTILNFVMMSASIAYLMKKGEFEIKEG
jgi:intracellular septation protein